MGKKKKSALKYFTKFGKNNKVMVAAFAGAAAGIAIAGVLGTKKAAEILKTAETSVKDFGNKVADGLKQRGATESYSS
jgi:hypothetical protein